MEKLTDVLHLSSECVPCRLMQSADTEAAYAFACVQAVSRSIFVKGAPACAHTCTHFINQLVTLPPPSEAADLRLSRLLSFRSFIFPL